MNKQELMNGVAEIKEELRNIVDAAETEKRSLSDEEKTLFEEKQNRLNELKESLATVEAREQAQIEAEEANKRNLETKENKNKRNISMNKNELFKQQIADALQAVANNRSTAEFDNVHGNQIELREVTKHDDDTEPLDVEGRLELLEPLQDALLVNQLGVRVITSNKALTMPSVNEISASIEGEDTELTGQKLDFSKRTVSPKRCGVSVPFTGTAIRHADRDLVAYAMKISGQALAALINKWMFSPVGVVGNDSSTAHKGLFVDALATDASVAKKVTWENIVGLETAVLNRNVAIDGTAAYVLSPATAGALKSAPVALKGGNHTGKFIIEDGKINGYPYLVSNCVKNVDASGNVTDFIGFGVFSNAMIQEVGTPVMVVDNLSKSKKDITEINTNAEFAVDVIRPEAFSCFKIDPSTSYTA